MFRLALPIVAACSLILPAIVSGGAAPAVRDASNTEFFERRIRPLLVKHCYQCHSAATKSEAGLRLDTRDSWRKGGDSGIPVVPGHPEQSLLIEVLGYRGDVKMPPKGKLPQSLINDFETWIQAGATVPPDPRPAQSARLSGIDLAAGRKHWAYRLPADYPAPKVRDPAWPRTQIDAFILSRLEAAGRHPAPDADRETLVRRLYFDLCGLPPAPQQIDSFLADRSPEAYERLVGRLLASPYFGERWGRHWLDVVRFAESLTLRGFVFPEAWRYRDYVIDAFDSDLPYDQFLREQIAGDLLPGQSLEDRQRQLVATSVLVLGNTNLEDQDKPQLEMDIVDEQLDLIGRGFLAQTITCARCHDHKFDPIPTRDYYALAGILKNAKSVEHANVSKWIELPLPQAPEQEVVLARQEQRIDAIRAEVAARRAAIKQAIADGTPPPNDKLVSATKADQASAAALKLLVASGPKRPMVMTVIERAQPSDLRVNIRGSVHDLGALAPRGFLQVVSPNSGICIPPRSGGRRELADWLVDRRNPLTARVMVNRIWHWLFGAGLVRTTDNFGTTGDTPSHPQLLDHLAVRFIADGWSVKRLVRRIVLSRTYQLSALADPRSRVNDPENRLLAHRARRRLEAECLRDGMLTISGALRSDRGGPGFRAGLTADYGYSDMSLRRSVYLPVFRNALPAIFDVFDFANPSLVTGSRSTSTVAPQALYFMNHPFVLDQSLLSAKRLLAERDTDDGIRLTRAYRLVLGRRPTAEESAIAARFLASASTTSDTNRVRVWAQFMQALFATVDFRYLD